MTPRWLWPYVGPTPTNDSSDSEMFDRTDYPYTETFVREAIQNSLDARLDKSKPVRISFSFHSGDTYTRTGYLGELISHRQKAGLDVPEAWSDGKCEWLLVEDFNSTGLLGDLNSRKSDFWGYWLNFGRSNKDGSQRGGRGIGRITFLLASQLRAVIGFTRRHDDGQTAVCGMGALKALPDGDDFYSTHAYLAQAEKGNIYRLLDSNDVKSNIRDLFKFDGYQNEHDSGLGLAILYPHSELNDEVLFAGSIENFAPAIFSESLIVEVNGRRLDRTTIEEISSEVAASFNDQSVKSDSGKYIELITTAASDPSPLKLYLPNARKGDLEAFHSSPDVQQLYKRLADGEIVTIELSFPLSRHGSEESVSIRAAARAVYEDRKPFDRLFREGMSLPDVRTKNPGELDLVFLIEDGLLATYLNFCEGKAHLDLLESKEVQQKLIEQGFGDGASTVAIKRLVKSLPFEMRRLLTPTITSPEANVFDNFFSKPTDSKGKKKKPKEPIDPVDPPPPPRPAAFKVRDLDDGFRLDANPDFDRWPTNFSVRIAYADGTRRPGWSPMDFKLKDLSISSTGCTVELDKNRLTARECGPDTTIEVRGFDVNRELDTTMRAWTSATEN